MSEAVNERWAQSVFVTYPGTPFAYRESIMQHMSAEMQQCIENCQKCHATCLSMASTHCLEMGGAHVAPDHFRLMMDCAQICATSADFMLRGSKHHPHVCAECADVCEDCAKSCEQLDGMEECVQACRTCAQSCSAMAQMAT